MTPPAHEQLRVLVQVRDRFLDMRPLVDIHKVVSAARSDINRIEDAYRAERGMKSHELVRPVMDLWSLEKELSGVAGNVVKLASQIELHIHRLERECLEQLDADYPDTSDPEYHEQARQILDAAAPGERAGISRIGDEGSQIIREEWEPSESEVIAQAAEAHVHGYSNDESGGRSGAE